MRNNAIPQIQKEQKSHDKQQPNIYTLRHPASWPGEAGVRHFRSATV